jgi:hypothetical protein
VEELEQEKLKLDYQLRQLQQRDQALEKQQRELAHELTHELEEKQLQQQHRERTLEQAAAESQA